MSEDANEKGDLGWAILRLINVVLPLFSVALLLINIAMFYGFVSFGKENTKERQLLAIAFAEIENMGKSQLNVAQQMVDVLAGIEQLDEEEINLALVHNRLSQSEERILELQETLDIAPREIISLVRIDERLNSIMEVQTAKILALEMQIGSIRSLFIYSIVALVVAIIALVLGNLNIGRSKWK